MFWTVRKIEALFLLTIVVSVVAVFFAAPQIALGITTEIDEGEVMPAYDFSSVPDRIMGDALTLAQSLYGNNQSAKDEFTRQLIGTYLIAKEHDVVVMFNPGGWGWKSLDDSPDWSGIAAGMKAELEASGYNPLLLNYRRSNGNLKSYVDEFMAILDLCPVKANELAARIEFLTRHTPGLKVIAAGESNGTIICDQVMSILSHHPSVYSIQTGTPFWHKVENVDRTLIINDNGLIPDTFHKGDVFIIISTNLEIMYGYRDPAQDTGTILNLFDAPGHAYSWRNFSVRSRIQDFLGRNFGVKEFSEP